MKIRQKALLLASAAALILSATGLAWACTPQSYLFPLSPKAGAPGTKITVTGKQSLATDGAPVELRWNSQNGPLVGTGLAGDSPFTATATVPDVAPGIYYLVVAGPNGQGLTRTAFEVTASPGAASSSAKSASPTGATELWSGFSSIHAPITEPQTAPSVSSNAAGRLAVGVALSLAGSAAMGAGMIVALRSKRRTAKAKV